MNFLDETDIKILGILQENARIPQSELAEKVNLSPPSTGDRLRKLEEKGIIKNYSAKIDLKLAGYDIMAFIFISMESSKHYHSFSAKVKEEPEILECHTITGDGSHILKVAAKNTSSLEKLLSKIQAWNGVTGTKTDIILSTIKESNKIKINLIQERKT